MRQTSKVLFSLCLNMLFISEILMIRSSAQVKSFSATLVVHRVYEPIWRSKWNFLIPIQIPFPSGINPELLLSTIEWDSFGPRPGWAFLSPSLLFLFLLFGAQALQDCALGSQSSIMEGISLSCGEQAFSYIYWFLMHNYSWSFFTKSPTMLTYWDKGNTIIDNTLVRPK